MDVNTHPTKTEVKFSDEKLIFETVYYGVKNALMNYSKESSVLNPTENISYKNNGEN